MNLCFAPHLSRTKKRNLRCRLVSLHLNIVELLTFMGRSLRHLDRRVKSIAEDHGCGDVTSPGMQLVAEVRLELLADKAMHSNIGR